MLRQCQQYVVAAVQHYCSRDKRYSRTNFYAHSRFLTFNAWILDGRTFMCTAIIIYLATITALLPTSMGGQHLRVSIPGIHGEKRFSFAYDQICLAFKDGGHGLRPWAQHGDAASRLSWVWLPHVCKNISYDRKS